MEQILYPATIERSHSIPEYKQAMREKESAEAEIEILKSEKIEIAEAIAGMDSELESGKKEMIADNDRKQTKVKSIS